MQQESALGGTETRVCLGGYGNKILSWAAEKHIKCQPDADQSQLTLSPKGQPRRKSASALDVQDHKQHKQF